MDGGRSPELHCYQKGLVWALGHVCRGLGQPWNIAVKPRERDSTSVPNPYTYSFEKRMQNSGAFSQYEER